MLRGPYSEYAVRRLFYSPTLEPVVLSMTGINVIIISLSQYILHAVN